MTPATLLLIRHGETEWNRDGRYQGRSDTPLSAHGETQARDLAERLAASGAGALVTSPLRRARDTAGIIAARLGITVAVDQRLLELAYGEWEGLRQAEIKQRRPELLRQWKLAPDRVVFPGGESLADVRRRVRSFLEEITARVNETSGPVVAVTHEAVIRIAVLDARGEPLSMFRRLRIGNASITALQWRGGRFHAGP